MLPRCGVRLRHPSYSVLKTPTRLSLIRRYESTSKPPPTSWRKGYTSEPSTFIDDSYARHALSAFSTFGRLIKVSVIGLFGTGLLAWTAFEGTHMWVEKIGLAPEYDDEVTRWEWDLDAEKWTGGSPGGTDPALGFKGRHAVRSAWVAQNWGIGSSPNVIGSNAFANPGSAGTGGLS